MNEITVINNSQVGIVPDVDPGEKQREIDNYWWRLYSVKDAVEQVRLHVVKLGGYRTPERHTMEQYEACLFKFLVWCSDLTADEAAEFDSVYDLVERPRFFRFPGPGLLNAYIAECAERGLATATVNKYLAPIRHFINALLDQYVPAADEWARSLVYDVRFFLGQALKKKPADAEKTTEAALYHHGTRLTKRQVDDLLTYLAELPADDLLAARDLALIHLGFNTGLRDAELRRLTLGDIEQREHHRVITVRGKRNNTDPVPLDELSYKLIMRWVEMYNGGLDEDDPRRIGRKEWRVDHLGRRVEMEVPIFQPLRRYGHYVPVGLQGFDPVVGCGRSTVRDAVKRRSMEALGFEITPHDLRRTVAAIAQFAGVAVDAIQRLLRHQSADTTAKYIGEIVDLSESMISRVFELSFTVGDAGQAFMRRFDGAGKVERRE